MLNARFAEALSCKSEGGQTPASILDDASIPAQRQRGHARRLLHAQLALSVESDLDPMCARPADAATHQAASAGACVASVADAHAGKTGRVLLGKAAQAQQLAPQGSSVDAAASNIYEPLGQEHRVALVDTVAETASAIPCIISRSPGTLVASSTGCASAPAPSTALERPTLCGAGDVAGVGGASASVAPETMFTWPAFATSIGFGGFVATPQRLPAPPWRRRCELPSTFAGVEIGADGPASTNYPIFAAVFATAVPQEMVAPPWRCFGGVTLGGAATAPHHFVAVKSTASTDGSLGTSAVGEHLVIAATLGGEARSKIADLCSATPLVQAFLGGVSSGRTGERSTVVGAALIASEACGNDLVVGQTPTYSQQESHGGKALLPAGLPAHCNYEAAATGSEACLKIFRSSSSLPAMQHKDGELNGLGGPESKSEIPSACLSFAPAAACQEGLMQTKFASGRPFKADGALEASYPQATAPVAPATTIGDAQTSKLQATPVPLCTHKPSLQPWTSPQLVGKSNLELQRAPLPTSVAMLSSPLGAHSQSWPSWLYSPCSQFLTPSSGDEPREPRAADANSGGFDMMPRSHALKRALRQPHGGNNPCPSPRRQRRHDRPEVTAARISFAPLLVEAQSPPRWYLAAVAHEYDASRVAHNDLGANRATYPTDTARFAAAARAVVAAGIADAGSAAASPAASSGALATKTEAGKRQRDGEVGGGEANLGKRLPEGADESASGGEARSGARIAGRNCDSPSGFVGRSAAAAHAEAERILQVGRNDSDWVQRVLELQAGFVWPPSAADAPVVARAFRVVARRVHPDGREHSDAWTEGRCREAFERLLSARAAANKVLRNGASACLPGRPATPWCAGVEGDLGSRRWVIEWKQAAMKDLALARYELLAKDRKGRYASIASVEYRRLLLHRCVVTERSLPGGLLDKGRLTLRLSAVSDAGATRGDKLVIETVLARRPRPLLFS